MTTDTVIEKKTISSKKIKFPKKYKVIVCNDDVTPIDFVIAMLMTVFNKSEQDSYNITMEVHKNGKGIAGIYAFEIAEQKMIEGINLSRAHGWPLTLKTEEE